MSDQRPDPDALLAHVQSTEALHRAGRLKVFFGYAAGVGKTYAMLEAAQRERAAGIDVVVGYLEHHGRAETEALLAGLEQLPNRPAPHTGPRVKEFDLDAALARKPHVLLVDELAHTNAPGSRHTKRWQDVQELLAAGIDVYTTVNVQHIESLNDIVAQITGVAVRETVPDAILQRADQIELIDLTPDDLMERLRLGKIYLPEQAQRALQKFFQRPNLVALRELSLRQTADRLHHDVQEERRARATTRVWPTTERLLVCVGPSPTTPKVIRSAKRLADAFRCDWIAACVEPADRHTLSPAARQRLVQNLKLAERLGAETTSLFGPQVAAALIAYARERNVTKIVVGKTDEPWWRRWRGTIIDDLLRLSGEIEIYVIRGTRILADLPATPAGALHSHLPSQQFSLPPWPAVLGTVGMFVACTGVAWAMTWLGLAETNLVMAYLLGTIFVSVQYGRMLGILASLAGVLAFDFFFVQPYYTFAVSDGEYLVTFGVFLVVALTTSTLTVRLAEQMASARHRESRTAALFRLGKQLAATAGSTFLVSTASRQLAELLGGELVIWLPSETGNLELRLGEETSIARGPIDKVVAQWVFEHEQMAGAGTDTLPNALAVYFPLTGSRGTVGVLGIRPVDLHQLQSPDQRQLLETCASLTALALERDQLALESQQVLVQAEAERLRNSLLSAVSHDLRTPLAAITGAGSSLLEQTLDNATREELLETIVDESQRMSRLVENLLQMTRLESAAGNLQRQWNVMEEIVGSALHRARLALAGREIITHLPATLPMVQVDGLLIEQVIINLLENAAKYSPSERPIEIRAQADPHALRVEVLDGGPGLPQGEEKQLFDKFYRGRNAFVAGQTGAGLGLTICKAIIESHQGTLHAENRSSGGARFWFSLPLSQPPSTMPALSEHELKGGNTAGANAENHD